MRIGFDAKRAAQNATGLGNYSRFVIGSLLDLAPGNDYLLYVPSPSKNRFIGALPPAARMVSPRGVWRACPSLWRVMGMSADLRRDGIDLFHGLSNELPSGITGVRGMRSIVTIHDLIFLRYPSYYKAIDRRIYDRKFLGLNSSYSLPVAAESYVELECTSRYASHVGRAEVSRLYFRADSDTVRLAYSLNGGEPNAIEMRGQGMKVATVSGDIHSVKWTVGGTRAPFWGVALEGRRGIVVDNLSLRGSSGFNFLSIPQETLRQFAARREYDLIILQYGLNVATADRRDYKGYKDNMVQVVGRLKSCFPGTSILLFSVGDRMSKDEDGNLVTMPGIVNLASYQQAVAVDTGIAWWSLLDAFKSLGGISAFANAKPAMANLDYTHINFRGGKRLAEEFFEALMCGKENYDNARAASQGRVMTPPPTDEERQLMQH